MSNSESPITKRTRDYLVETTIYYKIQFGLFFVISAFMYICFSTLFIFEKITIIQYNTYNMFYIINSIISFVTFLYFKYREIYYRKLKTIK